MDLSIIYFGLIVLTVKVSGRERRHDEKMCIDIRYLSFVNIHFNAKLRKTRTKNHFHYFRCVAAKLFGSSAEVISE